MNFIEVGVEKVPGRARLKSDLFPTPVYLSEPDEEQEVTLGIRPEHIRIEKEKTPQAVRGEVVRKSIVVGGQYLVTVRIAGVLLKAKIRSEIGMMIGKDVWVELPAEHITVFRKNGYRMRAGLMVSDS